MRFKLKKESKSKATTNTSHKTAMTQLKYNEKKYLYQKPHESLQQSDVQKSTGIGVCVIVTCQKNVSWR